LFNLVKKTTHRYLIASGPNIQQKTSLTAPAVISLETTRLEPWT